MEVTLIGGESITLSIDVKVNGISGGGYTITTEDVAKITIDGNTIIANDDVEDGETSIIITSDDDNDVSVTIPITLVKRFFRWVAKQTDPVLANVTYTTSFETNYPDIRIIPYSERGTGILTVTPQSVEHNITTFSFSFNTGGYASNNTISVNSDDVRLGVIKIGPTMITSNTMSIEYVG